MSTTRRHVVSVDDLVGLRAEAIKRLLAGDPGGAAALVRDTRPSGALCTELAALRGEVRARAAVAAGDEAQAQIALTDLVRAGRPSYSGWSTGAVMLSVAELRARVRGPIACFDHTGRGLLRDAREELKGTVWCNDPAGGSWPEDDGPFLPAGDPLLDEARVALSRSYSVLGRVAPTRTEDGWDVPGPDRRKPAACRPVELPAALDKARGHFEAARAAADSSPRDAERRLRASLQALVCACTPRWPAEGGPWWSAPASGLIIDVAHADGPEGRHRLALADTIASWEDDDVQSFWWPVDEASWSTTTSDSAGRDFASSCSLYGSRAYLREALVHAAGSGLLRSASPP